MRKLWVLAGDDGRASNGVTARRWRGLQRVALPVVVGCLLAALIAGSAARANGRGGSAVIPRLVVGLLAGSASMDVTKNLANGAGTNLTLEPVTGIGADGKVRGWLARSIGHPTGAVYIYYLRK